MPSYSKEKIMRKFMITVATIAAMSVGACASSGSGPSVPQIPATIDSVEIVQPDALVPSQYARFSGVWAQNYPSADSETYTLLIRSVSAKGYVTGVMFGHVPNPWRVYFSGKIEGNTLHWKNPYTGSRFTFAMVNSNSVTLDRDNGLSASHATLSKVPETAWPKGVTLARAITSQAH